MRRFRRPPRSDDFRQRNAPFQTRLGALAVQLLHADVRDHDLDEPLHRGRFPLVGDERICVRQEREVLDVLHAEARVERLEQAPVLVVGQAELGPDARVHANQARVLYSSGRSKEKCISNKKNDSSEKNVCLYKRQATVLHQLTSK